MRLLGYRRTGLSLVVVLSIVGVAAGLLFRPTASLGAPTVPVFDDVSAAAGLRTQTQISFGLQWADYVNDSAPTSTSAATALRRRPLPQPGTARSDVSASSGPRLQRRPPQLCLG
jgi:hypothetical protein